MTNQLRFIVIFSITQIIFGSSLLLAADIEHPKGCNSTICHGMKLYENGHEKEGIQSFLKAAQAGDPNAQRLMSSAHIEGAYIEKDYRKAFTMFKQIADQNDAVA